MKRDDWWITTLNNEHDCLDVIDVFLHTYSYIEENIAGLFEPSTIEIIDIHVGIIDNRMRICLDNIAVGCIIDQNILYGVEK